MSEKTWQLMEITGTPWACAVFCAGFSPLKASSHLLPSLSITVLSKEGQAGD